MSKKHGAYWDSNSHVTVFFWMGEEVEMEDFNERVIGQMKSAQKDIDMFFQGFQAKKTLNAGQRALSELHALEEVSKLPLCEACRKLIGDAQ